MTTGPDVVGVPLGRMDHTVGEIAEEEDNVSSASKVELETESTLCESLSRGDCCVCIKSHNLNWRPSLHCVNY